jgi:hypothetical protein
LFTQRCARAGVLLSAFVLAAACTSSQASEPPPGLAERGTVMTTATPTRQDLTNSVSLSGTVTMNPVFGLVAPVAGQMRYLDVKPPAATPAKPTRIGAVWANGKPTNVEVPAGATFAGRLVDDKSTVTVGMPIASAKLAGYGLVAEISSDKAYQIADGLTGITAQIKNGPGPFPCAVLGTIAALPAGSIPEPPPADPPAGSPGADGAAPGAGATAPVKEPQQEEDPPAEGSSASGLRLVCTAPGDIKLINGAAATLKIVTQTATNALVVPVEAVAGGQGKGTVEVVKADGSTSLVQVALGLTDGKVVEIKSGLTGDEKLSVPGPNLPPAPDAEQPSGGK